MSKKIQIFTMPVEPLGVNCTVLIDSESLHTVIIDPGGNAGEIHKIISEQGGKTFQILLTHAHYDHVLGVVPLASLLQSEDAPVTVAAHPADQYLLDILHRYTASYGYPSSVAKIHIDIPIEDGATFTLGDTIIRAIHTPGHTPGSVSFYMENEKLLMSGDTLFYRSIGRTDLPGGNSETLFRSIREKLFVLDPDTTVITGHGELTNIGDEKSKNPFITDHNI